MSPKTIGRVLLPVVTLWWREMVRFVRQRHRLVATLGQPLLFWILLGGGLGASFRPPGGPDSNCTSLIVTACGSSTWYHIT